MTSCVTTNQLVTNLSFPEKDTCIFLLCIYVDLIEVQQCQATIVPRDFSDLSASNSTLNFTYKYFRQSRTAMKINTENVCYA